MTLTAESLAISEAAEASGLSVHTLRYYEREGLLPRVTREESGHRRFGRGDLEWAKFITCLRATGMPIRQVRRYVTLYFEGDQTEPERLALLEEHRDEVRAHLADVMASLERVEMKIASIKEHRHWTPAR